MPWVEYITFDRAAYGPYKVKAGFIFYTSLTNHTPVEISDLQRKKKYSTSQDNVFYHDSCH